MTIHPTTIHPTTIHHLEPLQELAAEASGRPHDKETRWPR